MINLKLLIAELESAKAGSRELSDKVLLACGWSYRPNCYGPGKPQWGGGGLWTNPLGVGTAASDPRPSPTESLDTALTLMPENYKFSVGIERHYTDEANEPKGHLIAWCILLPDKKGSAVYDTDEITEVQTTNTPALCLCIAALKAREAMG